MPKQGDDYTTSSPPDTAQELRSQSQIDEKGEIGGSVEMTVPIVISAYQRDPGPDALGSNQPQFDEASLGSAEVVRESRLNTDAIDTNYNNQFE